MKRLAAATLAVVVTAAPANAQDGLMVDPESPAGKEYALPLEAARRDAAGARATPGRSAPLFGDGIGPAPATSRPAGSGERAAADEGGASRGVEDRRPRRHSDRARATTNGSGTANDNTRGTARGGGGRPTGGLHGTAVVRAGTEGAWTDGATAAALAAALLVLGGVLGSILRRRAP